MRRLLLLALLLTVGCSSRVREVRVRVLRVEPDVEWGYIGEDYRTYVEVIGEGWRTRLPGNLGEPGDEFTAYYVEPPPIAAAPPYLSTLPPFDAPEPTP